MALDASEIFDITNNGQLSTDPYWGKIDANIDWCEPNYVSSIYVAEFWNSLSSIPISLFAIFGAILCARYGFRDFRYQFAFLALFFVGIGSMLFHMTLRRYAQALDELPMLYGSLILLHNAIDLLKPPRLSLSPSPTRSSQKSNNHGHSHALGIDDTDADGKQHEMHCDNHPERESYTTMMQAAVDRKDPNQIIDDCSVHGANKKKHQHQHGGKGEEEDEEENCHMDHSHGRGVHGHAHGDEVLELCDMHKHAHNDGNTPLLDEEHGHSHAGHDHGHDHHDHDHDQHSHSHGSSSSSHHSHSHNDNHSSSSSSHPPPLVSSSGLHYFSFSSLKERPLLKLSLFLTGVITTAVYLYFPMYYFIFLGGYTLAVVALFVVTIYNLFYNPLYSKFKYEQPSSILPTSSSVNSAYSSSSSFSNKYSLSVRFFRAGLVFYGFGFVLWCIENAYCNSLSPVLHLHAIWHVTAGLGTYFQIQSSIAFRAIIHEYKVGMAAQLLIPYVTVKSQN